MIQPTLIMGVVNITPDSFSDGGQYASPAKAIAKALELAEQGAHVIDLGAESSRPGAQPVSLDEEWSRLEPVINGLIGKSGIKLSIDSYKPEIMLRSAQLGCQYINDINGRADKSTLAQLGSNAGLSYIAMHKFGDPKSMQDSPLKGAEAISQIDSFFDQTHKDLLGAGFEKENIWLDPGIGFGKTDEANALVIANCSRWAEEYQLTLGVSRKSFIGRALGIDSPVDRDPASKMLEFGLACMGVQMIRTHEVSKLNNLLRLL